ncbi:MAG: ADP-heptose--LPS heptosyltransferase 2 [Deltaproteobacteria bacterium]|nr:ADP-heptose--LPS heptosyltransferase 2 [Deltaproteobacteria bacterium]
MVKPKKILVIRFSALGDLVLTTPIFRELKRVFPKTNITLLTSSGIGSVLKSSPHIDQVIWHARNESYIELKKLINNLRDEKYDLIYDAHRSVRSIWIVWKLTRFGVLKIPEVWSINKRSWRRSLLIQLKINFLKNTSSQRHHLLAPLQDRTKYELNNQTELFPDQIIVLKIRNFLNDNNLLPKKFFAIGASASYPLKCWPLNYFKELITKLIEQKWQIVLVGGENEKENMQLEQDFSGKVISAAGMFSPLESAELLRHARIVVTNDSSVGHLAEAMRTPAIVLFGSTVKEFGYAPFMKESILLETEEKLSCRPCSKDGRGKCKNPDYLRCMTSITPERVLSNIDNLNCQYTKKPN